METNPAPKLSTAKSVGFRPGHDLREKIDALAADTDRDISDILRDGVTAFWPEIEALNRQLGRRATAEELAELRAYLDAGRQAKALGLDLGALVKEAMATAA